MSWFHRACVLVLLLLASCGDSPGESTPPPAKNVLLVVVDALRADFVGCYGYSKQTTPFLDELAARGVRFERAWAGSSHLLQSLSVLFTGLFVTRGGAIGLLEAQPSAEATTLAEAFRERGFSTALVSAQPLVRGPGFKRGFGDLQIASQPGEWSGREVSERALEVVDAASGPFFLTVHYGEPHEPHVAPEGDAETPGPSFAVLREQVAAGARFDAANPPSGFEDVIAGYEAEIRYVDGCIEALIGGLQTRGVLDDTLIIVTSSHGEELLEHGYVGHGWTLHEEVLRIPCIVVSPGELEPAVVRRPVSHADLVPTLQSLFALEGDARNLDGRALLSWDGARLEPIPPSAEDPPTIAELVIRERCVLRAVIDPQGRWKLIAGPLFIPVSERAKVAAAYAERLRAFHAGESQPPDIWDEGGPRALFDLHADPGEERAAVDVDAAAGLEGALDAYREYCASHGLAPSRARTPAELREMSDVDALKALGYM